jgi:ubiquinone/menaquinone biosynthesis C-methylase UbiE
MKYYLKKWARTIVGLRKIQNLIIEEAAFSQGDKVIDIGCGTGMLLEQIYGTYGNDVEYMGIEPDEATRLVAEKRLGGKGIKFKRAFAHQLPSVQDYYTHAICMVSFHHFPHDQWKVSLEELKRVMAPKGKLIIVEFGRPTGFLGRLLSLINPCRKLSVGLENYLKIEAKTIGLDFMEEKKQFGYITHLVFTK